VSVRTGDAECGDDELRDALRTALNTKEYADKVAAQLYHEQVRAATHSILSTHKKKKTTTTTTTTATPNISELEQ